VIRVTPHRVTHSVSRWHATNEGHTGGSLLWLSATLSGCVPNGYEASTVVLLATPLAVAVGYGLVAGLVRLARRPSPEHPHHAGSAGLRSRAPRSRSGSSRSTLASGEVDVGEWYPPGRRTSSARAS
jgi:hypothetical protein